MTPEQFKQFIDIMGTMSDTRTHYTITGAADWPMFIVLGGVIMALIGAMWFDLSSKLTNHRIDWRKELNEHKTLNISEFDKVWSAIRDCQDECCPRRRAEPRKSD